MLRIACCVLSLFVFSSVARCEESSKLTTASLSGTRNVHVAGNVMLAGQPGKEAFTELSKRGYKTVITLRQKAEERFDEAALCKQLGMKFIRLSINSPSDIDEKLIKEACELLRSAEPKSRVLLHCASANRVGAIWLAHCVSDKGMKIKQARAEAAKVGLKSKPLEDVVLQHLQP